MSVTESLGEGDYIGKSGKNTGAETWEMKAEPARQRASCRKDLKVEGTARADALW